MEPRRRILQYVTVLALGVPALSDAQNEWTHLAQSARRDASSAKPVGSIAAGAWTATVDTLGRPITFVGPASVVANSDVVVALGSSDGVSRLFAFDRATGVPVWETQVAPPFFDSWSSPALDLQNNNAIVASGSAIRAVNLNTGAVGWETDLGAFVVNASPLVTSDLGPADRAFITTFNDGYTTGLLHCVNVDSFDAVANPFQPGELLWSADIKGSSGSTPAYRDGVVYVASTETLSFTQGVIFAFPAGAVTAPEPLWTFDNPPGQPFFSGVLIDIDPCGQLAVYAASFEFFGGQFSANLVKVRASDGALVWTIPSARTDSIPVPLGDGRLALSTGIDGFGAVPSVQLFEDKCSFVVFHWDSALATWEDANGNGLLDLGEFQLLGGWNHQPALVTTAFGEPGGLSHTLYVGAPPLGQDFFDLYADLRAVDLDRFPDDPGFVREEFPGAGGSPALADHSLFSVGPSGLVGFPRACPSDCTGDSKANVLDLVCYSSLFMGGDLGADCNDDGVLNALDFVCFQALVIEGCP